MVQQTCLEAHRDFGGFRGEATPELLVWLRRILDNNVANLAHRHVVAEKRSVRRERSLDDTRGAGTPPRARLRSNVTSPSQRAMRGESALLLAHALTRLPEEQREAVRLRHLEGLTLAQMAAWFERSDVAVASLLKRRTSTIAPDLGRVHRRRAMSSDASQPEDHEPGDRVLAEYLARLDSGEAVDRALARPRAPRPGGRADRGLRSRGPGGEPRRPRRRGHR